MDLTVDFSVMLRNGCLWFIQIAIVKTILYNCNVWMLDSVTDSGYLAIDWLEQRGSWNFYSYIKILNLEYVQSSATLVHYCLCFMKGGLYINICKSSLGIEMSEWTV
jgi:hypothetical protein